MSPEDAPRGVHLEVPALPFDALLHQFRATVLSCDIEGGELALFETDLSPALRLVILEIHPKLYGDAGTGRVFAALSCSNLVYCARRSAGTTVVVRRVGTQH